MLFKIDIGFTELLIISSLFTFVIIAWKEILNHFGLLSRYFPERYLKMQKEKQAKDPHVFAAENNQPPLAREKWLGEVTDTNNPHQTRIYFLRAILDDKETTPIDELVHIAFHLSLDVKDSFSYDKEVLQLVDMASKRLIHVRKLLS